MRECVCARVCVWKRKKENRVAYLVTPAPLPLSLFIYIYIYVCVCGCVCVCECVCVKEREREKESERENSIAYLVIPLSLSLSLSLWCHPPLILFKWTPSCWYFYYLRDRSVKLVPTYIRSKDCIQSFSSPALITIPSLKNLVYRTIYP